MAPHGLLPIGDVDKDVEILTLRQWRGGATARELREYEAMTDGLVVWLRARLADEAATAQAAADETSPQWTAGAAMEGPSYDADRLYWGDGSDSTDFTGGEAAPHHAADHDPARVLRAVTAKRRTVDLHADMHACPSYDWSTGEIEPQLPVDGGDCTTLRLLAAEYADRPGYREEWRR